MNDDFVKCAGEALCMQYALVNTDSLIESLIEEMNARL